MTYNASIPQSTDLISVSQGQLLVNFGQLNTQFAVDHNAFSAASANGNGHHKQVSFDVARLAPSLSGTQSMVYPKTVSAAVEPFYANASTDNVVWYGGAGSGAIATASGATESSGSLTLPSGHIMKWGYVSGPITSNSPISFPTPFPNACFSIQITGIKSSTGASGCWLKTSSLHAADFTVLTDSANLGITYWAIGR